MPIEKSISTVYACDCCDKEFYRYCLRESQMVSGDIALRIPASVMMQGDLVICMRCAKAVAIAYGAGNSATIAQMWLDHTKESNGT